MSIDDVWKRYVYNLAKYQSGKYYDDEVISNTPKKHEKSLGVTLEEINKYSSSIEEWVDAQFFVFIKKYKRRPTVNQIHSGVKNNKAYERLLIYRKEQERGRVNIETPNIIFRIDKEELIRIEKEKLEQFCNKFSCGEDEALFIFADQFSVEFIEWWNNGMLRKEKKKRKTKNSSKGRRETKGLFVSKKNRNLSLL